MNCKPVLYDTLARDRAAVTDAETMRAALLANGWAERAPGVFGLGPGLEEDDAELSAPDSSADVSQAVA